MSTASALARRDQRACGIALRSRASAGLRLGAQLSAVVLRGLREQRRAFALRAGLLRLGEQLSRSAAKPARRCSRFRGVASAALTRGVGVGQQLRRVSRGAPR